MTDKLVNVREIDEPTAEILKTIPSMTVFQEDGKFFVGRTPAQQADYDERRAEVEDTDEEKDEREQPETSEKEYREPETSEEPEYEQEAPRPMTVSSPEQRRLYGPCTYPRNAERDRVARLAIKDRKTGRSSWETLEKYVEDVKDVPPGIALSPKQAHIVIVERVGKSRKWDDFNCEKHDRVKSPRLVLPKKDRSVRYLIDGWIPYGVMTMCAGDKGTGKSSNACLVSAKVSRGEPWHDGREVDRGRVLYYTSEPDPPENWNEMLGHPAFNADLSKIRFRWWFDGYRPTFENVDEIVREIIDWDADLVVFDTIDRYLGVYGDDLWHKSTVEEALVKMIEVAVEGNVALLATRHITKRTGRIHGSIAFETEASRVIQIKFENPAEKDGPRVVWSKYVRHGDDPGEFRWNTKRNDWTWEKLDPDYFGGQMSKADAIVRRLFPVDRFVERTWDYIERERVKARISERTMRDAMSRAGVRAYRWRGREALYARTAALSL